MIFHRNVKPPWYPLLVVIEFVECTVVWLHLDHDTDWNHHSTISQTLLVFDCKKCFDSASSNLFWITNWILLPQNSWLKLKSVPGLCQLHAFPERNAGLFQQPVHVGHQLEHYTGAVILLGALGAQSLHERLLQGGFGSCCGCLILSREKQKNITKKTHH